MGRCCIWKINRNHSAEKKHSICLQTFYLIRIPFLITRKLMFNLTNGMDPNKNIILGIIEYLNSIVLSFSIFFQNMSCSICAIFCSENMNILFLFLQQNGQPRMTHILGKSYNESDLLKWAISLTLQVKEEILLWKITPVEERNGFKWQNENYCLGLRKIVKRLQQ